MKPPPILGPVRYQFLALLPTPEDRDPWDCHNPRISDAVVFGCGYERAGDGPCSATTLRRRRRRRRDEWIAAGVTETRRLLVPAAYNRVTGLELDQLSADGCITKAPTGGECAGKSPANRVKQGIKRSQLAACSDAPGPSTGGTPAHETPAFDELPANALIRTVRRRETLLDQLHAKREGTGSCLPVSCISSCLCCGSPLPDPLMTGSVRCRTRCGLLPPRPRGSGLGT